MGLVTGPELLFRDQRRAALVRSPTQHGLDFVVAHWDEARKIWALELRFLPSAAADKRPVPDGVTAENVRILIAEAVEPAARVKGVEYPEDGDARLTVLVQREPPRRAAVGVEGHAAADDLPVHTLELIDVPGVDRFFSRAYFVFRDGGTDPGTTFRFPERQALREAPEINYLAKDFASFRQLMLEHMARFVPSWRERSPADLGVTLVEVLAYAADYLSYYQDAVATEAYLSTARQRVSVRRHTRLIDYRLHEGSNARCWAQVLVERSPRECPAIELAAGTEILTSTPRVPRCLAYDSKDYHRALEQGVLIFQTMHPVAVYPQHDRMEIYTWQARDFVLPAGTTTAALKGHFPNLKAGDVVILHRRAAGGPGSAEVDPRHCQPLRLCTAPVLTSDPPPGAAAGEHCEPITEIEWFGEDELRVDFPVSEEVHGELYTELTVVRGNVVMVDHGQNRSEILEPVASQGRYAPRLTPLGLTFRVPFDAEKARREAARDALEQDPRRALPAVELAESSGGSAQPSPWERWQPRRDLLGSGRFAQDFTVEMDDGGFAHLRFGDDLHGRSPRAGTVFEAAYRVGRGPAGNVGVHALHHLVLPAAMFDEHERRGLRLGVDNLVPGTGGTSREPVTEARLFAPEALNSAESLRRCVTMMDYAEVAGRHSEVHRAVAERRWSGTWNVAHLYVQRYRGRDIDQVFEHQLASFMQPYLLTGWDLKISPPRYVPLDLQLTLWPEPTARVGAFRQRLRARVAEGAVEFLDPDHFTFGQTVYLSDIIAQVKAIPEVADVRVDVFHRWGEPPRDELENGEIPIGPLEIARIGNDPSAPHRGTLKVVIGEAS